MGNCGRQLFGVHGADTAIVIKIENLIMPNEASLIDYYAKRANEYERIYQKPERQADMAALRKLCAQSLAGEDVLAKDNFTAGMAMHWWSHLRKSEIENFLDGYHRVFRPGALLVFMDNRFVGGSSTPISRTDNEGNTYQLRRLEDGTEHEVLKNFPSENEIKKVLAGFATEIRWTELPYYWFLTYRLKP